MSASHFAYQLFIGPLELIFEIVYGLSQNFLDNCGLSIIVLSFTVNTLLLPLYRCADVIQENAKKAEKKLEPWVAHIKKTFKGDEQFMMLQAYYRQNNYRPFYVLKSSLPLFLEIPFFIAAYHFLSNLETLNGVSFGPIENLGAPDGLLSVSGMTINMLPLVMTLTNCASSMIYAQDLSLRDKMQLYGMALIFFVLLYESPSGLVFYWTLNNLFSLGKNIFYKTRKPQFALASSSGQTNPWLLVSVFVLFTLLSCFLIPSNDRMDYILIAFMLEIPVLFRPFCEKRCLFEAASSSSSNPSLFVSGCVFLALLSGVLIPSSVIVSSPAEFVQMEDFYSPLRHILNAACLSVGFFVIWPSVFYCMAAPKMKSILEFLSLVLSGIAVSDYMLFGTKLGILSSTLQYEINLHFSDSEKISNFVFMLACSMLLFYI